MLDFEFKTTPSMVCRDKCSADVGAYFKRRELARVLVVTDKGITALGLHMDAVTALETQGIEVRLFDGVIADPPESIVNEAINVGRDAKVEAVLGIGGGSTLDTAKLVALALGSDQLLEDMYGVGQASGPRLPLALVPTTAGTGSEATQVAIVTTGESTKSGVVSEFLYPDVAFLDASLTSGLPAAISAATGIDAMVHAIEAFTSKVKKNAYSDMLALQALQLLDKNIKSATLDGSDLEARQGMLLGSYLAGQAFSNAPVGGVHALAYPLGGRYHIPHGLSNALVLPHVLRFNGTVCESWYQTLVDAMNIDAKTRSAGDALAHYFETLIADLGLPTSLHDAGVKEVSLKQLAQDAMEQTRLLVNNPREINYHDALSIYQTAYGA